MSRGRRAAAWLFVLGFGAAASLGAQSITLHVSSLRADSMPPAPVISVHAVETRPDLGPYTVSVEMSLDPAFPLPFYTKGSSAMDTAFTTDSWLPQHTLVYFRARLTDRFGFLAAETRQQHPVRGWVTLIEPAQQSLVVLPTRTPRFVWSSPATTLTAGFLEYELSVISNAGGASFVSPWIADTSYVFPDSLESNASYRWQVRARSGGGNGSGEATATSAGTIVIGGDPTFTLLYQNFPNPFRRGQITCFWFDLAAPGRVRLTIYDLRLHEVRKLIPGPIGDGTLPIGVYGRDPTTQAGCDSRISWDATDDNGRPVPPGVYIAEFRVNGKSSTKKILFLGP